MRAMKEFGLIIVYLLHWLRVGVEINIQKIVQGNSVPLVYLIVLNFQGYLQGLLLCFLCILQILFLVCHLLLFLAQIVLFLDR